MKESTGNIAVQLAAIQLKIALSMQKTRPSQEAINHRWQTFGRKKTGRR